MDFSKMSPQREKLQIYVIRTAEDAVGFLPLFT